jgi:hypothetical protein
MKKEERDAMKKLAHVMEKQLLVMLSATEIMVSVCESVEKALEGVKLLALAPEGPESEPKAEKPLDDEEYDGYVEYTKFIEQPENRRVIKGRIKHIERNPPTIGLDEVEEATPEQWEQIKKAMNLHPEEESGWIG